MSLETTTTYQKKGAIFSTCKARAFFSNIPMKDNILEHASYFSDDLGLHIMPKEARIAHQNGNMDA